MQLDALPGPLRAIVRRPGFRRLVRRWRGRLGTFAYRLASLLRRRPPRVEESGWPSRRPRRRPAAPAAGREATFVAVAEDEVPGVGPTAVTREAARMAMAAQDLCAVLSGRGTESELGTAGGGLGCTFWFRPAGCSGELRLGRLLPHPTGGAAAPDRGEGLAGFAAVGPYLVREDVRSGTVIRTRLHDVAAALRDDPPVDGARTALFLLPFVAVGGAEKLLLRALEGLSHRYRCLVVTLDRHRRELGIGLDEVRATTPHVYTLGDWLPRECRWSAVRHLLRVYGVETLVSWNGTVDFYDRVRELRRSFPDLRIAAQLYNHEGGWMDRTIPSVARAIDLHLAVNRRIAAALVERARVPAERIAVVEHAVPIPELPTVAERERRRRERRRELEIPAEATVVGTFVRMHPQKRPADVVALARRMPDTTFLLVGGGPLEAELRRDLACTAVPNLRWLPMRPHVEPLFDALDICLLTSAYEGLPVFLLEGLAREIPGVATAVGDIPALFGPGGGLVVDRPGDLAGLEAALNALATPEERARRGRIGRQTVATRHGLPEFVRAYAARIFPEGEA